MSEAQRHTINLVDPFAMYRAVRATEPLHACDICGAAVPMLSVQTHTAWHERNGR